jgi:hypothetical protein
MPIVAAARVSMSKWGFFSACADDAEPGGRRVPEVAVAMCAAALFLRTLRSTSAQSVKSPRVHRLPMIATTPQNPPLMKAI